MAGLAGEVAYLRERFDQRGMELEQPSRELAAERERADVIQQLALQRIEALTATVAEHRQGAPTAAPEAPGATEAPAEGDPRLVVGPGVDAAGRRTLAEDHPRAGGVCRGAQVACDVRGGGQPPADAGWGHGRGTDPGRTSEGAPR